QHPEGRARHAMNGASLPDRVAPVLRILVLALLAAAPLAFGSVHEAAFTPLLVLSSLAGLVSWAKGHWARAQGAFVPRLPGGRARRRLAGTVVAVGLVLTVVGLVQARSGRPGIYGLWRPTFDWAVYGPYVNRNHFAGYMVMAIPLALGFALEALGGLRRAWQ